MATTGKFNGDLLLIYADGSKVLHTIDATLSLSQELPDSTTKDSSQWVEHIHGNRSFEVSGSGLVAFDAAMNAVEMAGFIINQSDVSMRFSTSEAGDKEWRGQVSISASSISAPQNSSAGYDFTMVGNGPLTEFTIT